MVKILMMLAKMATPDLLKIKSLEIKVITSSILSMTSQTKIYQMSQIILWMWSRHQSLVNLAFV